MKPNPPTHPLLLGILLITLSAIGYGLQPIFGKLAYAQAIAPSTANFGRFLIAALLFEIHYLFLPRPNPKTRLTPHELTITTAIALLYAAATFCYYLSLQYLSPVIFSFLYYTYPLLTLFAGVLLFRDKIHPTLILAFLIILLGAALLLNSSNTALTINPIGVLWILGCALCMAFFFQFQKFLPRQRCRLYHARIMIRIMTLLFLIWWLADGAPNLTPTPGHSLPLGWLYILLIGCLCTYLAFTAAVLGIARLGANYAALLSSQEPLWTALFALLIFGVTLQATQWLGATIMLTAIIYINHHSWKQTKPKPKPQP